MKKTLCSQMLFAICITLSVMPLLAQNSGKAKPGSIEYARQAAFKIDQHVAALFKKKNITAPENVDDLQFLRRTSLVMAGRIPTFEESSLFLDMTEEGKRETFINYVLDSEGYKSSMKNWIYDLLRAQEVLNRGKGQPYIEWMRASISDNKSWKDMTHELITAEGSIWNNGAVGYYIRDKGMPLDNLANSMRLFMGTHMECAQCHDDPSGEMERKDFFHLAAFSHHQPQISGKPFYRFYYRDLDKMEEYSGSHQNFLRVLGYDIYQASLKNSGSGRIKLPEDYQYNDGEPGEFIGGKTPFAKKVRTSDRKDTDNSRHALAEWMTSRDNPRFATTIANRLWKRVFGTGLYEPIDVYVEPRDTKAPALTAYITQLIQDLDYDMKEFQRVLLFTRIYNFKSALELHSVSDIENLRGRQLQRMTAEQIWDSLITLTSGNPDTLPQRGESRSITYGGKTLFAGEKDMVQLAEEMHSIKDNDEMKTFLIALLEEYNSAKKQGKNSGSMMMTANSPGPLSGFVRASELPTPAPEGHMLREFGQSDRRLLEGSTKEGNINQILSILNGHFERLIVSNPSASLHNSIKKAKTPEDKVHTLFLAILGRTPSPQESEILVHEVKTSGEAGIKNIIAGLLNSREFIFIQ